MTERIEWRRRVIDRLTGRRILPLYRSYVATQHLAAADGEAMQVAKLRALLMHCEQHVPYYARLLRAHGVRAAEVRDLDVLQVFPIMDKGAVKEHYADLQSRGSGDLGTVRASYTGGTTGEPLRVPKDARLRASIQAAMWRFHDWMGVRAADPKAVVWGAPIVRRDRARALRQEVLSAITRTTAIDAFRVRPDAVEDLAALLRRHRVRFLQGYCLSLFELASWLGDRGIILPLTAVSTTVEPLFAEYRQAFRRAFQCEAYDQYGCGEVEAIAYECEMHGGLHVVRERVILETLPSGDVVLTDLDNRAMPFIRYRNGDLVERAAGDCACGRAGPRLARVLGRSGDVIVGANGRRLHPEFFTHLVNETGVARRRGLRRYQVVQRRDGRLEWRVVAEPLDEADRQVLRSGVQAYLGDVPLDVIQVEDIPAARSGKFQYVVRETP